MNRPGAVVVGSGFGARVHVPALRAAGFEVTALVGRDAERTARRARRAGVPHGLTSLGDALRLDGVVAVTVAAPPAEHAPLVTEALDAGRHVLCEKPFCLDRGEAETLRTAAAQAGVVALVGHEFRFAAANAAVAAAISAGRIGTPVLAIVVSHVALLTDPTVRFPAWWSDPGCGGGWLGAWGSHAVDGLRTWLGDVVALSGRLMPIGGDGRQADAAFSARLRFASGADAALQGSAAALGSFAATRIVGSEATVWIDAGRAWLRGGGGVEQLIPPAGLGDDEESPPSDDPAHRFTHLELVPYVRLAQHFRAAIEKSPVDDATAPATFHDGVACMAVLDAIRESSARGGELVSV